MSLNGETSQSFDVKYSVPQGSCLGPALFILYVSKLFTIVERHLPKVHTYAGDRNSTCLQACTDIRKWMLMDKLMLNDKTTEFSVIGTRQQLVKVKIDSLFVSHTAILPSSEVRSLEGTHGWTR